MKKKQTGPSGQGLVITAVNSITAVGHDGEMTADAIFTCTSAIAFDENHEDEKGRPIKTAVINGLGERTDETGFMAGITEKCLSGLLGRYFDGNFRVDHLFFFLGLPPSQRPGPQVDLWKEVCLNHLERHKGLHVEQVRSDFFSTGNASAYHGVQRAAETVKINPLAVCVVGGADSLLSPRTLSWLEKDLRLVSESEGRQHGLFPSHAAGFIIVESEKGASIRKKQILSRIVGHAITREPAPFVSELPTKGDGLTLAIQSVMETIGMRPSDIDTVLCDLNGEYHRFREWGFADIRCFPTTTPDLVHPADCMGDVGAAWLPVLAGIASEGLKRGAFGKNVMVFCADDHGECGALILRKP